MKEFLPEIEELIAKVLTEEATVVEQIELKNWLAESPDNQQYFAALQTVWTSSSDAVPTLDVDTDKAWVAVRKRIQTPKPLIINRLSLSLAWKAAAAIALLISATWWFTKEEQSRPLSILADLTSRIDTLSDKSIIELNKKSSITYQFSKKERRVKMEGEAYFAVAPDKTKPFFIEVKNLEIQVVGTAFKVDNFSQTGKVIVVVEEGVVKLKGMGAEETLTKGQKAIYNTLTQKFEQEERTKSSLVQEDVKLGVFDFKKVPVKNVLSKVSEYFKVPIDVNFNSDCFLDAVLNFNDPIEDILLVVTDSCDNIAFKKENGRYIIFKKE
jgi:ferric-dicitrate binding protein FerR (iron transport regulator)